VTVWADRCEARLTAGQWMNLPIIDKSYSTQKLNLFRWSGRRTTRHEPPCFSEARVPGMWRCR
jgi:hypothetical protein